MEFHPECEAWADDLNQPDAESLLAAIRVLRAEGPALGRPLVDTVKGSRHPNMKELRPAFDSERQAMLLVGGDKGADWDGWYKVNIPVADDRFDEHQAELDEARRRSSPKTTKRDKKGSKR